jgi:DNA-binding CsgD family transcriptional regulator
MKAELLLVIRFEEGETRLTWRSKRHLDMGVAVSKWMKAVAAGDEKALGRIDRYMDRVVSSPIAVLIDSNLTENQTIVLRCAAQGMTTADTAEEMGISPETVKTHRRHVIQKMGARNMRHAVGMAAERGWV